MLERWRHAALTLVAVLPVSVPALAQEPVGDIWVSLATRDLGLATGSDTIELPADKKAFKAVRLQNTGEAIEISRVRVVYGDDSFHIEERRINLLRNDRTRPIDPRATGKAVSRLVLTFKPVPGASKTARITVSGLLDERARPSGPSAAVGPVKAAPAQRSAPAAEAPRAAPAPSPHLTMSAPAASPAPVESAAPKALEKRPLGSEPSPASGRCLGRGHLLVGSASLDPAKGREMIRAPARLAQFASLKLCVLGEDVQLASIRVRYDDASQEELPFSGAMRANHRSEPMPIRGDRFLQSLDLTYAAHPGGTAEVEVWGELAEDFLDTRARLQEDGWMPLVSLAPARFIGFTVDKEEPGRHREGFSQVRILARDRDISADYLSLRFADGGEQRFELKRARIESGKPSPPLQIEGGRRVIVAVEARYRSRFFDPDAKGRDKALVDVWGHR